MSQFDLADIRNCKECCTLSKELPKLHTRTYLAFFKVVVNKVEFQLPRANPETFSNMEDQISLPESLVKFFNFNSVFDIFLKQYLLCKKR